MLKGVESKNTLIFSLLLFFGIFLPTSTNGVMSNKFSYFTFFILFIFFSFIKKKITWLNITLFLLINLSLFIFSIYASFFFSNYSFGIYPNFFFLSILFFLDLKAINVNSFIKVSFLACTFGIILLGFGVIFRWLSVLNFILNFYSAGYDALLPNMLARLKPVGTFATHSVAAFFIFLFFYLNIKSYKILNKFIYLFNAIILLIFLFFIRSNSALVFIFFSFFILFNLFKTNKTSLLIVVCILAIIPFYFIFIDNSLWEVLSKFDLSVILSSDKNGLQGRYSSDSPLQPTIDYILANPFSPTGLTVSDKLYYSDSGFILYFLRGSLFLLVAIYFGISNFIKNNILNRKDSLFIVFILLLFEIGYPILINLRMLFFIPFTIIYLNYIQNFKHES